MRRFLRRVNDGGGILDVIDPKSLGPVLYLNSLLGMGGSADGASVATWFDQSGFSRDASQATASHQPVMRRSGIHTSKNGSAMIQFTQALDPNNSQMSGVYANNANKPVWTNGATIIAYGNFQNAPTDAQNCMMVYTDGMLEAEVMTCGNSCGYGVGNQGGYGLSVQPGQPGGRIGTTLQWAPVYGSVSLVYGPPNNPLGAVGSGSGATSTVYVNGVAAFTAVTLNVLSQGGATRTYTISSVNDACPLKADLGAVVVFDKPLTAGQRFGVEQFFKIQFG